MLSAALARTWQSGTRHELCRAVHAEQNAIIQAAMHGISIEGATLYCTHQPCILCAKMMINATGEEGRLSAELPGPDGAGFFGAGGNRGAKAEGKGFVKGFHFIQKELILLIGRLFFSGSCDLSFWPYEAGWAGAHFAVRATQTS